MRRGVTVEEIGTEESCTKKIFEKLQKRNITKGRMGMKIMNSTTTVKMRRNNRQECVHLCFSGCQDKFWACLQTDIFKCNCRLAAYAFCDNGWPKKQSKHSPNKERLRHCGCHKETDSGLKNEPEMSWTDNTNLPFRREKSRWAEKCSSGIWKMEILLSVVIVGLRWDMHKLTKILINTTWTLFLLYCHTHMHIYFK